MGLSVLICLGLRFITTRSVYLLSVTINYLISLMIQSRDTAHSVLNFYKIIYGSPTAVHYKHTVIKVEVQHTNH